MKLFIRGYFLEFFLVFLFIVGTLDVYDYVIINIYNRESSFRWFLSSVFRLLGCVEVVLYKSVIRGLFFFLV